MTYGPFAKKQTNKHDDSDDANDAYGANDDDQW